MCQMPLLDQGWLAASFAPSFLPPACPLGTGPSLPAVAGGTWDTLDFSGPLTGSLGGALSLHRGISWNIREAAGRCFHALLREKVYPGMKLARRENATWQEVGLLGPKAACALGMERLQGGHRAAEMPIAGRSCLGGLMSCDIQHPACTVTSHPSAVLCKDVQLFITGL